MTNPSYANLNTKSHFSCGLGIGTSAEIIKAAQDNKLYAIALTDRCTASGLLDFYNKGKELKFPVILGVELYVYHNTELFRLILLAKNQNGYTNICKLITASSINKEAYKRPCVSLYDLKDNCDDLYCLSNELTVTDHLQDIFKDHFYYEVILEDEHIEKNKKIVQLQNFVISSDAYIPTPEFKILQDIMISNTAFGFSKEPFKEVKSILSLADIIKRVPRGHDYLTLDKIKNGLSNSIYVATECKDIELKFKDQIVNYPHLLHPLNHDSSSKETLVRRIIEANGRMKYDDPIYVERLEYELQTIQNNGRVNLIDYFLVLEDLCRWSFENNIAVGPGRGSGAGSLVNYCLKVTHLDPIKYGLLFERFISAGRIQNGTLPDVDLDFSEQEPVRQHAIEMYGEDRVIPIGTMQTLKARGAIKDIFRAFHPDLEFQYVQNICNALGTKDQDETEAEHFEFALETSEVIQKAFKEYPDVEQYVKRLLGYNRQPGIHPCFSGDMRLFTENGYKTFKELNGTMIKALTLEGWKDIKVFENGYKKTYVHNVKAKAGSSISRKIVCTRDHKFLSSDLNDVTLESNKSLLSKTQKDFDIDYVILGWAWNDGWFDGNNIILCYTTDKDYEFKKYFENVVQSENGYKVKLTLEYSKFLLELGYDCSKTKNKKFPKHFDDWSMKQKLSWMRGMYSANGYVVRKSVGIKLVSRDIIESIHKFMNSIGFETSKVISHPSGGEWNSRETFNFYFLSNGNRDFSQIIGFIQSYKNSKILNEWNTYSYPREPKEQHVYDFTVIDGLPYGLVEGTWAHNCGLAITQDSLRDFVPLRFDKGKWVNEYTASDCEKSGIIKFDVLGLKTLKYIQTCLSLLGIDDLYSIPLDDAPTFKAFVAGDTASVFQFNSDVSKNILMQLPLHKMSLDTLSMVTSVGRPGPMKNNQHNEFIKRVNGARSCKPPHEALQGTLQDTYGIMIYQESVMKASEILGGFNMSEADEIRRAMGKKKASILAPYKSRFIDNCKANYVDTTEHYTDEGNKDYESKAEYIWELMATFSGYGFNKSHSMCYALIGYYCQYLKVNYPLQWWTACMTHADSEQLRLYYQECSMMTLNPDINKATSEFFITEDKKIQMPFTCIKGLGPKAAEEIATRRPYTSFDNFVTRVNKTKVNKSVVEKLIFCGCFDSFETNPQVLINQYYEFRGETKKIPEELKVLTKSKISEMRAKGLSFLSMDYYKIYPEFFPDNEMIYFQNLVKGPKVCVGGIVTKVIMKKTKNGKDYCDVVIANDGEDQSIRIWGDEYEHYKKSIEETKILKIMCNTSEYNSKLQLTATNIIAKTKE